MADETWARLRLNQVWPFLVSGVPAPTLDDDTYLYGRMEFTASRVLDGRMLYVSALGPQPREGRGGKHYEQPVYFFLHSLTQCERQIGRVIDRLLQLGTLRLAAIIALPALKSVVPRVEAVEKDITDARVRTHDLIQYAKSASIIKPLEIKRRESEILVILDNIQSSMASLSNGTSPPVGDYLGSATLETRLLRSMYYKKMFMSLVKGLRLARIEGYQVYDEFVERRLGGAFGFIEAVEMRVGQIKSQWRALDQLYLTTAVTLLAGEIEGQQSKTKMIQSDIARIQLLGETILIAILAPYYLTNIIYHVIDCEHKAWCSTELIASTSVSQLIPLILLTSGVALAYWRARVIEDKAASSD